MTFTFSAFDLAQMDEQEKSRRADQATVNNSAAKWPDQLPTIIRDFAAEQMERYPQYAGHWDGWVLVRFTRELVTKGGLRFRAGDYTLAHRNGGIFNTSQWMAWSLRGGLDVSIPHGYCEEVK
jgi:hypothetical protein